MSTMLERLRSKSSSKKSREREEAPTPEADADRATPAEAEDGGAWRLAEEESGEDEILQVRSSNAGLASSIQAGVATSGASPRSGTSTVASYSQKEPHLGSADIVVPGGSSLLDGLRLLLVHHLKGSAGTDQISLTTGQAELLEHHLSRLASYAQKIVHTLAFATRFLSSQPVAEEQSPAAGSVPLAGDESATDQGGGRKETVPVEPRKRTTLRLKDRELLQIYRSAQIEASKEADWRGFGVASPSRSEGSDFSDVSALYQGATTQGSDAELLKALSRAMREPGRSPEALAAEIVDSSRGFGCCQTQKGIAAREARGARSSMVRWPQSPPDPGGRPYGRS
mmetsp:Transcript_19676/g.40837  ORF Transcript_19676/g.40837 Transcript_19676/m.40837 type:complete len:340 (+) Transcript_19676:49-1068(+)